MQHWLQKVKYSVGGGGQKPGHAWQCAVGIVYPAADAHAEPIVSLVFLNDLAGLRGLDRWARCHQNRPMDPSGHENKAIFEDKSTGLNQQPPSAPLVIVILRLLITPLDGCSPQTKQKNKYLLGMIL